MAVFESCAVMHIVPGMISRVGGLARCWRRAGQERHDKMK
jgi:hypothetical protein